jgi:hypothetical protein
VSQQIRDGPRAAPLSATQPVAALIHTRVRVRTFDGLEMPHERTNPLIDQIDPKGTELTTKRHVYVTIICEGCGQVHGMPDQYADTVSARKGALDAGWQLIPKTKANGQSALVDIRNPRALSMAGANAHDVCSGCADNFTPRLLGRRATAGAAWWTKEIAELKAENARLRAAGVGRG